MAPKCELCLSKILSFNFKKVGSLEEEGKTKTSKQKTPKQTLLKNVGWVGWFVFVLRR